MQGLNYRCIFFLFFFWLAASGERPPVVLQTLTEDGRTLSLREGDDPCQALHLLCCSERETDTQLYESCFAAAHSQLTQLLTASWRLLSPRLAVRPSLFLACEELDRKHHDNSSQFGADSAEQATAVLLDILRKDGDRDLLAREFDTRRNDLRMTTEEQVELYRQAILLEPSHPLVVSQFGVALLASERESLARALFADAVRRGIWPDILQRPVNYYVPGLASRPWYDARKFAFTEVLQRGFEDIRSELLAAEEGLFYVEPENRNSYNTGGSWKTLVLQQDRHTYTDLATHHFPRTVQWLKKCEEDFLLVKFSALEPGTVIHPHTGPSNERLRSHLTLVHSGGARLRVGREWRTWEEGQVMVFDSSWEHEVVHEGAHRRIVLILDVWHPQYINSYSDGH